MPRNYIPRRDVEFADWLSHLSGRLSVQGQSAGLSEGEIAALNELQIRFAEAYDDHLAAGRAAAAALQKKLATRAEAEKLVRGLVGRIQSSPATTDALRGELRITIPDRIRTAARGATLAQNAGRPIVTVDTSMRLRHVLKYVDESTPQRRARPKGAIGCQIWMKVCSPGFSPSSSGASDAGGAGGAGSAGADGPPKSLDDMRFIAQDTATPYTVLHDGASANQTAHYILRWALRGGTFGPLSETVSATVVG